MKRLLALLLMTGVVLAQAPQFSTYHISLSIDQTVEEEFRFSLNNPYEEPLEEIELFFASEPRNVQVKPEASHILERVGDGYLLKISLEQPILAGDKLDARVSFDTENWAEPINRGMLFSYSYLPEADIEELSISLKLPKGAVFSLDDLEGQKASVSPAPDSVSTDGERVILTWKKSNVKEGEIVSLMVIYSTTRSYSILYFILGGVLGASGVWLYLKSKEKEKKKKMISKVVPLALSSDEKIVYDILTKGETTQEELRKQIGYSKSKISKLVRNLEMKKLVKKTPYRKTNKLKLRRI